VSDGKGLEILQNFGNEISVKAAALIDFGHIAFKGFDLDGIGPSPCPEAGLVFIHTEPVMAGYLTFGWVTIQFFVC
jgi:hypothetical protein